MAELVADVRDDLLPGGESDFELTNDVAVDLVIDADRDQLYRVIGNIARNAAEAGARSLHVSVQQNGKGVHIDMRDDGPGLAPRALENLFQPFDGSAKAGGTGLGLAIAGELMRNHGGGLELMATGASGTCFRATLPPA